MSVTQERLKQLLDYDQETGIFTWCTKDRWHHKEKRVGWVDEYGYLHIRVDNILYLAHRLAWLYVKGEWPSHTVDHRNGIPGDDHIDNLRLATQTQNSRNSRVSKNNKIGLKGVCAKRGRWRATITVNRKQISLGIFSTPEEAHAAYAAGALKYHGDFARVQ